MLPMCGFIAQLVEHRTGIAEVMGSNPVEALIFQASSFQLLKLENLLRRSPFPLCYIKNNVAPPPPPTTLKTGLSCHHSFNNDKRCYVTSCVEKDVDRLIEDLDKAFAKYRGAYHIGSKSKTSEARKRKEKKKKSENRRLNASNKIK